MSSSAQDAGVNAMEWDRREKPWKSEVANLLLCPFFKARNDYRNLASAKACHSVLRVAARIKVQERGGHLIGSERRIANDFYVGRTDDEFLLNEDLVPVEYTGTLRPQKTIDAALTAAHLMFEEELRPIKAYVVTPQGWHPIPVNLVHVTWDAVPSVIKMIVKGNEEDLKALANVDSGLCGFCIRRCRGDSL